MSLDEPLVVLDNLPLSLQEKLERGVVWSGFIGWDDESSLDKAFPDFVVEGESDEGRYECDCCPYKC